MVTAAFSSSGGARNQPPSQEAAHAESPQVHALVRRVRLLCRREHAFARGAVALVLVSGGQDSLTLLHLLATGALRGDGPAAVRALHVNHHLRGAESDADEVLVRDRCGELHVPVEVVDAPIDKAGGNVQAEARAARRAAAFDLVDRSSNTVAVLGHTLDDQVETMLYRLGRYGGLQALVGMSAVDPPWVRPLLTIRRADTAAYCTAHGLVFAVDRGNEYPGYARTGLRGSVVPAWETALPGAVESAGRAAEVAAEAAEIVRGAVRTARDAVEVGKPGEPGDETGALRELSATRLLGLPRPLRRAVLRSLLEECLGREASRGLVLEMETLLGGSGSVEMDIGAGWTATREYGRLLVARRASKSECHRLWRPGGGHSSRVAGRSPSGAVVALACPGEARVGDLLVRAEPVGRFHAHDPRSETYLDAAVLTGPLWVRAPRPGDRMRPLGAPGRRLVQDILVDLKVPRGVRRRVPVIGCGECILWLGGCVVAEEGRISATTQRLIHLTVELAIDEHQHEGLGYGVGGT